MPSCVTHTLPAPSSQLHETNPLSPSTTEHILRLLKRPAPRHGEWKRLYKVKKHVALSRACPQPQCGPGPLPPIGVLQGSASKPPLQHCRTRQPSTMPPLNHGAPSWPLRSVAAWPSDRVFQQPGDAGFTKVKGGANPAPTLCWPLQGRPHRGFLGSGFRFQGLDPENPETLDLMLASARASRIMASMPSTPSMPSIL